MGIRTSPQLSAVTSSILGLTLVWCSGSQGWGSGPLGVIGLSAGVILTAWIFASRFPHILEHTSASASSRGRTANVLIALVVLFISLRGWQTHSAHRYTTDELCTLRQSTAFESLSATLPLNTFAPHLDPTGACFARSEHGYFSVQAPGWAATMAFTKSVGIPQERLPWILASLTLLIVGIIGVEVGGFLLGAMTIVALSHNQFFDEISRSYWSHSLAMLLTACGVLSLIHLHTPHTRNLWPPILAVGLISGALLLTRPLLGLSFMAGAAVSIAFSIPRTFSREGLRLLFLFGVGPLLGGLAYGYFNLSTTGSFFVSGYEYVHGPGHNPGFFHVTPNGIEHSPARAALLLQHHVRLLLRFVVPSLWYFIALLPIACTLGWSPAMRSIALILLSLWLGAGTYWDSSFFFGPRFYYESTIPLTLLVTSAYFTLSKAASNTIPCSPRARRLIASSIFLIVMLVTIPSPPVQ